MSHGSSQHGDTTPHRAAPSVRGSGWSFVTAIEGDDAGAGSAREDSARRLLACLIARRLSGSHPYATGQQGEGDATGGDAAVSMTASPPVVPHQFTVREGSIRRLGGAS